MVICVSGALYSSEFFGKCGSRNKTFGPGLEISEAFAIVLEVFSRFRVILRLEVWNFGVEF